MENVNEKRPVQFPWIRASLNRHQTKKSNTIFGTSKMSSTMTSSSLSVSKNAGTCEALDATLLNRYNVPATLLTIKTMRGRCDQLRLDVLKYLNLGNVNTALRAAISLTVATRYVRLGIDWGCGRGKSCRKMRIGRDSE